MSSPRQARYDQQYYSEITSNFIIRTQSIESAKNYNRSFIFIFLTVLTQTGGIAYFLSLLTYKWIDKKLHKRFAKAGARFSSFLIIHLISVFTLVPLLAKLSGRAPLPVIESQGLRPLTIWTCLLNRHYVTPELKEAALNVSKQMQDKYPGTYVNYLDANFPFFQGFPLIPHLSHNDGKKLDLAFCYNVKETGQPAGDAPSFIGYGVCEGPRKDETNKPLECEKAGHWQYSLLQKIVPQGSKEDYVLDEKRTKHLTNLFAAQPSIGKIFIEPHLQRRLGLVSGKIRFHGCHAVRHDDHIHVQLK